VLRINEEATEKHIGMTAAASTFFNAYTDLAPIFEETLEQYADLTPALQEILESFAKIAPAFRTTMDNVDRSLAEIIPKLVESSESLTKVGLTTDILLATTEKSVILLTDQIVQLTIYVNILVLALGFLAGLCILRQLAQCVGFMIYSPTNQETVLKCGNCSNEILMGEKRRKYSWIRRIRKKYSINEKRDLEEKVVLLSSEGDQSVARTD